MPKVSTIAEVKVMDADDVIKIIRGKITKRFERKSGETDKGPWSFETFTLSDGKESIDVSLKSRDPLPKVFKVGSLVVLESKQSEKHGWTGLKAVDEEYKGKTYRKIRATATASIELDNSGGEDSGHPSDPREDEPEPAPKQASQSAPTPAKSGNSTRQPKVLVAQIASAFLIAHRAGKFLQVCIEAEDKRKMEIEEFTAMRSTLFIQSCFEKAYWDLPPIHTMIMAEQKKLAPPKAEPKPEPKPEPRKPLTNPSPSTPTPDDTIPEDDDNVPF